MLAEGSFQDAPLVIKFMGVPTMAAILAQQDDTDILNYCAKYLARDNTRPRHSYNQYLGGDTRSTISEAWSNIVGGVYRRSEDSDAIFACCQQRRQKS
jgi:hypothetical protein